MNSKRRTRPLWVQLALPMITVLIIIVLGGVVIYETYWNQVLQRVSPKVRLAIENVRPSPKLFLANSRIRLGPGIISLFFSATVIILVSIHIARRILKPIEALERSVNAVSKQSEPSRGQFAEVLDSVAELAAKLEQSENARRIANAAIAHELRTPLTALRARVESLEFGVYPLELDEISKLHSSLDLLEQLIGDLQTVSLSEAGELHLELKSINLSALLLEVHNDLQTLAAQKGITLDCQVNPDILIQADPQRLRQVVHNLLENAICYIPNQQQIKTSVHTKGWHLEISIADSGHGVPNDELENLFTPFYRLEPSRSREYGGSGLGLAVVKAIITAHGGTVRAQKAVLGGLEIQIELPLRHSPLALALEQGVL